MQGKIGSKQEKQQILSALLFSWVDFFPPTFEYMEKPKRMTEWVEWLELIKISDLQNFVYQETIIVRAAKRSRKDHFNHKSCTMEKQTL